MFSFYRNATYFSGVKCLERCIITMSNVARFYNAIVMTYIFEKRPILCLL